MSESLLYTVLNDWTARGWDSSQLPSFRMQMAPGADGSLGTAEGGQGGGGDGNGNQGGTGGQGSGGSDYSLAEGFLSRVAPEHRSIVEPYVRQWDAGVSRRFGDLHGQLSPYQELGSYEDLELAMGVLEEMRSNPWNVYGQLLQALQSGEYGPNPFGMTQGQPQGQPQGQLQNGGQQQMPPANSMGQFQQGQNGAGQLPPEVAERLDGFEKALATIAQHLVGQSRTQQQTAEDDQVNDWLEGLHEEFGDFDDQWVLLQAYNDPETAIDDHIKKWHELTGRPQQQQQEALSGLPNLLGPGGGSAPVLQNGGSVKDLSRKQTRDLVVETLRRNAQQQ